MALDYYNGKRLLTNYDGWDDDAEDITKNDDEDPLRGSDTCMSQPPLNAAAQDGVVVGGKNDDVLGKENNGAISNVGDNGGVLDGGESGITRLSGLRDEATKMADKNFTVFIDELTKQGMLLSNTIGNN